MEALMFFVYAMIIFLLALLLCGTIVGYYFTKRKEFEVWKINAMIEYAMAVQKGQKSGTEK